MHSPFVFDFILNVLNNKSRYNAPAQIEVVRQALLADQKTLQITDLGAGSRAGTSSKKTISKLAQQALKPRKYAQVLYRTVKHYQPQRLIELGTSLGITTAYLSAGNPKATITTIEGSPSIPVVARQNFKKLQAENIQLIEGNFDTILPSVLERIEHIDLAYVDGNHRYQPTLNYFHQLLTRSHHRTILIFDDIHWSAEMEKAWAEIKTHPSVQYTIDIFFLGFVFFRLEFKVKQHFTIRF